MTQGDYILAGREHEHPGQAVGRRRWGNQLPLHAPGPLKGHDPADAAGQSCPKQFQSGLKFSYMLQCEYKEP